MDRLHIGDHCHIRRSDLGQGFDLSSMAHPHLQNGDLMILPQPENRQGEAQVIIEVALGFEDFESLLEKSRGELFGRCFSYTASNTHNFDGVLKEGILGQFLEGFKGVGDLD